MLELVWQFFLHRRLWFMIPLVVGLLLAAALLAFASATALGPWIYRLL